MAIKITGQVDDVLGPEPERKPRPYPGAATAMRVGVPMAIGAATEGVGLLPAIAAQMAGTAATEPLIEKYVEDRDISLPEVGVQTAISAIPGGKAAKTVLGNVAKHVAIGGAIGIGRNEALNLAREGELLSGEDTLRSGVDGALAGGGIGLAGSAVRGAIKLGKGLRAAKDAAVEGVENFKTNKAAAEEAKFAGAKNVTPAEQEGEVVGEAPIAERPGLPSTKLLQPTEQAAPHEGIAAKNVTPHGPKAPPPERPAPLQDGRSPLQVLTDEINQRSAFPPPDSARQYAKPPPSGPTKPGGLTEDTTITSVPEQSWAERQRENVNFAKAELTKRYLNRPHVGPWERMVGPYVYNNEVSNLEVQAFSRAIQREFPSRRRRVALTSYIQAGGDQGVLQEQAASAPARVRRDYEDALTLSPHETWAAERLGDYFDRQLDRAQKAGMLQEGIDNYITNIWGRRPRDVDLANEITQEIKLGKFPFNPSMIRKRIYKSYFDGERAGGIAKNKDAAFLAAHWDKSFARSIATRQMIRQAASDVASDGKPVIVPSGLKADSTYDPRTDSTATVLSPQKTQYLFRNDGTKSVWRPTEHAGLDLPPSLVPGEDATEGAHRHQTGVGPEQMTFEQADERNVEKIDVSNYELIDHPSIRKMKYVMSDSQGNPVLYKGPVLVHPEVAQKLKNFLGTSKMRSNAAGRALMYASGQAKGTLLAGVIAPFHQTTEGLHAYMHHLPMSQIFFPPAIDPYDEITAKLIRGGLTVVGDEHLMSMFGDDGAYGKSNLLFHRALRPFPVLNQMEKYSAYLFHDWLPKIRVAVGRQAYLRNVGRYGGVWTDAEIAHRSAMQMNDAFGGQNMMMHGRDKTLQDVAGLINLAPDFLESRVRFAAGGISGLADPLGGGGNMEQTKALIVRGMAGQALAAFLTALGIHAIGSWFLDGALSSTYHARHPFSVTVNGQEMSMRTVPGDMLHAVQDTAGFIQNRLNPLLVKPALEAVTQRDKYGRPLASNFDTFKDIVMGIIPIPLQELRRGLGNEQASYLEAFLDTIANSMGIHTWRYRSPASKYVYENTSTIGAVPMDDDDRARHAAARRIERASAQGVKPDQADVDQLTDKARKIHEKKGKLGEFEGRLYNLPLEKTFEAFDLSMEDKNRVEMQAERRHLNQLVGNGALRDGHHPKAKHDEIMKKYSQVMADMARLGITGEKEKEEAQPWLTW